LRFVSRRRRGVSSIVGSIFFILIMIVAIGSLVTMFSSFTAYNGQVTKASNSNLQLQDTQLSVTSSQFGAFPPSPTSNINVATGCTAATATSPTQQTHLLYAAGMWWDFFTCNGNFQYSTSFYGVVWEAATTIPNLVSGYTTGPDYDVEVVGSTLYLVIADTAAANLLFQLGIGTLASGGTVASPAGTITWTSLPASVATSAQPTGPIQISADNAGNVWVAVVQGTCSTNVNCAIGIYERQACASGVPANQGWENASPSCGSTAAPLNYAPTTPNLGAMDPNANMILFAPPTSLSPTGTGVILIYETYTAAEVAGTTGTLAVVTQTALASGAATWSPITLGFADYYSLTSSSAVMIGNTIYFAGLAGTTFGDSTCTGAQVCSLRFWTLPFTSMAAATPTTEFTVEATSEAWMAALTYSGTTLALFDAYTLTGATTIQYYTSSTLGSIWSSPAIALESSETASITGLSPSENGFAVTWENGASAVRFAALSTFTVANSSPFAVHLVDLYIYNSATNSLVAHYYFNSTEEFDYYIGQGSSMVLPIRFVWAATTSYLVTVATDTGASAQLTVTSPPPTSTSCSAGTFLSQISPAQACSGVPATESPAVSFSSNTNTCSVTSASTSGGFTTPITYTTNSLSSGNLYIGMTFNAATTTATAGDTSKWQFSYGTGTAPACDATTGLGTTVGQGYTVETQTAAAGSWGQSIGVAIKGLSPNTAYWFDVQVTDGGTTPTATWTYTNQAVAITDVLSATNSLPNVAETDNSGSCPHAATSTLMAGLGVTYTTMSSTTGSGNVKVTLSFNLATAGLLADTNKWQIAYGTGSAPLCGATVPPTGLVALVGKQYTVESDAAGAVMSLGQSESVVITGLSPSTTYWFDIESTDASGTQWTASAPTLAVSEEGNINAGNTPASIVYPLSAQTAGCATTAVATSMAGLKEFYTLTSSSTGKIYGSITVNVAASGTIAAGSTSAWKLAYSDVTLNTVPLCAALVPGANVFVVGQSYTTKTVVVTTPFSESQTEQFVITGLTPGHMYWFDLEVTNAGAGFQATYSVPTLSITDIQPANIVHDNTIQMTGNAPSCGATAGTNVMGGMAVIPTTANPPMEYQATSYGSGVVTVDFQIQVAEAATTSSTYKWTLAYGTVTDPQSGASASANPICAAAAVGTRVGNQYTCTNNGAALVGSCAESVSVVIVLSHATEYWFDFQMTNSATGTDTLPQMQIVEAA